MAAKLNLVLRYSGTTASIEATEKQEEAVITFFTIARGQRNPVRGTKSLKMVKIKQTECLALGVKI